MVTEAGKRNYQRAAQLADEVYRHLAFGQLSYAGISHCLEQLREIDRLLGPDHHNYDIGLSIALVRAMRPGGRNAAEDARSAANAVYGLKIAIGGWLY